jgi:hypothetical protein
MDVLYFKNHGDKWCVSHEIEDSGMLLMSYFGFHLDLHTKVFPHFDPVQAGLK